VIQFYGGEPLLAFDLVVRAVERLEKENRNFRKRPRYVLTTNGALLRPEILSFLNEHRFELMLSFDGLAQEKERRKGSFRILSSLLDDLPRYPGIKPATNSVFCPRTVGLLSESVAYIAERNVPDMLLSFDYRAVWPENSLERLSRELRIIREYMLRFPRAGRTLPLINFRRPDVSGIFGCSAGRDRLALAPDGRFWGCYLYADFYRVHPTADVFRRFCFGTVGDFIRSGGNLDHNVLVHYSWGRMDWAETSERACGNCPRLDRCAVCPPAAALKSGKIGMIPVAVCRINRILIKQRELFWKKAAERAT
jgi:MoaA/NifB/PqqE/SkfB family radical SAM enzyme